MDRDTLKSSVLTHAAIQGMTDSLGDSGHTVYLNPEMRRHAGEAMRSHFTGIGIEIKAQDRRAVVVATFDGSPALLAGVRAGDIILEVDGRSVVGLPLSELEDLITGAAGKSRQDRRARSGRRSPQGIQHRPRLHQDPERHLARLAGRRVAHLRVALFGEGYGPRLPRRPARNPAAGNQKA